MRHVDARVKKNKTARIFKQNLDKKTSLGFQVRHVDVRDIKRQKNRKVPHHIELRKFPQVFKCAMLMSE